MTNNEQTEDPRSRPDWVCQRAVAWALDEAPCPAELLATLIAIARRCWIDGTGSYQSKATLAEKTGKSQDQASADVKRLLELGLIRLGDQSLPERHKVPFGKRPTVYDAALEMRGPKPARTGRNKTGKNRKDADTPGMDTGGGTDTGGGMDTPGRGGIHTAGGGVSIPPKEDFEKDLEEPISSLSVRTSLTDAHASAVEDRERDAETINRTFEEQRVIAAGAPPDQAAAVIAHIRAAEERRGFPIGGPGWWVTAGRNGSLSGHIAAALACLDGPGPCECGKPPARDDRQARNGGRGFNRLHDSHANPERYYEPYRDPRRDKTDEEILAEYSGSL